MTNKRTSKRVPFRTIVRYGQNSPPGFLSFATDLSERGVCIKTNSVFTSGTRLYLTIVTSDNRYEAEGVVVWAKKVPHRMVAIAKNGMGIKFTHVDKGLMGLYHERLHAAS